MAKVYKATTLGFLIGLTLVGCASTHRESQEIRINTKNTDDFEVLLDNLSLMSIRLEQLEGLYNDAKLSSSLVPFSEVFSEGQEAYLNKDHARTITLFDPLSRDPINFNEPLFPAAIFYLADAHFRLKNFDLSRLYFERLARLPNHQYLSNALEKLALIAKERRDWVPLQPFLIQIQDLPSLSPIAKYALGYAFHQLQKLEEALPLYEGVPENSEWFSRARYARAVALIALSRSSEAREELNLLLELKPKTGIDAAVKSWARLSSARLHFEMDSLEDATRDYQAIERESPHFAESIHELAQTQVRYAEKQIDIGQRRKAFERALATLELLFILDEEEQTIAEALMLKASIFIRLGKIDDAKLTLAYLMERFDPLTSYMQDLPQRIATLTNYYDLLSPGFQSDSLELVPMVSEYLAGGKNSNGAGYSSEI